MTKKKQDAVCTAGKKETDGLAPSESNKKEESGKGQDVILSAVLNMEDAQVGTKA